MLKLLSKRIGADNVYYDKTNKDKTNRDKTKNDETDKAKPDKSSNLIQKNINTAITKGNIIKKANSETNTKEENKKILNKSKEIPIIRKEDERININNNSSNNSKNNFSKSILSNSNHSLYSKERGTQYNNNDKNLMPLQEHSNFINAVEAKKVKVNDQFNYETPKILSSEVYYDKNSNKL